ncbi:MAG: flagellar biosynthesis anti-sigma factor FlgM [Armatimonadota bacterium]
MLSPRAAAIQIVKEKAAALPEVRQDVVQNVIQRLQSDAYRPYRPDPDELAQRILSANVRLKGKQQ